MGIVKPWFEIYRLGAVAVLFVQEFVQYPMFPSEELAPEQLFITITTTANPMKLAVRFIFRTKMEPKFTCPPSDFSVKKGPD